VKTGRSRNSLKNALDFGALAQHQLIMAAKAVYPCFPNATRGQGTTLKTDPKRNLVIYALDRTVRLWSTAAPAFARGNSPS